MTDVINYCDLYVHAAEIELEGIACLEAITCGKMVIVSNSKKSATKNFVIDDNCIFKSNNPKDLAKVMDFWLENPSLKKQYEEKYLKDSKKYNQNYCMEQMEQMIVETAKKVKKQSSNNQDK